MVSHKIIFLAIILLAVALLVSIWYTTNVLQLRDMGYIYGMGIFSMIITFLNVGFYSKIKHENRQGIMIYLAKFFLGVIILLIFSFMNPGFALYYTFLSAIANIMITVSLYDNIFRTETKETDFHISIHDENSPIKSPLAIVMTYCAVFFLYGGLVWILGNTLISYPLFGALGDWMSALPNSFGVGDPENILFIVFAYAISEWGLKKLGIRNSYAIFIISLMISLSSFETYHTLIYGLNIPAQISIAIFGAISITLWRLTKSMICSISPLHDSNNFFGTILKKTVFGQSVFSGGMGNLLLSVSVPIIMLILAVAIIYFMRKNRGRR